MTSGTVTYVAASGAQAFLRLVTGAASVILTKIFAPAGLGAKIPGRARRQDEAGPDSLRRHSALRSADRGRR